MRLRPAFALAAVLAAVPLAAQQQCAPSAAVRPFVDAPVVTRRKLREDGRGRVGCFDDPPYQWKDVPLQWLLEVCGTECHGFVNERNCL